MILTLRSFGALGGMWASKTLNFIPVFTTILVNSIKEIWWTSERRQYSSPEFPRQGNKNVTVLVYVKSNT